MFAQIASTILFLEPKSNPAKLVINYLSDSLTSFKGWLSILFKVLSID